MTISNSLKIVTLNRPGTEDSFYDIREIIIFCAALFFAPHIEKYHDQGNQNDDQNPGPPNHKATSRPFFQVKG
jgi:hypothetical protein